MVPAPDYTAQQTKLTVINQLLLDVSQPLDVLSDVLYKLSPEG